MAAAGRGCGLPVCGGVVATQLRWQPAADAPELAALKVFADGPCQTTVVQYTPAP